MTTSQITKFVSDVATVVGKAGKLQETLQTMMESAKDQKAFKEDLYKAAKEKSDTAYDAVRQLYRRALKALGWITTETRGTKSKKASAKPTGKTAAPAKEGGMSDALAIARVGQLATSFLTKDDQVIMSRLLAALDHQRKLATKSK
jgi:peptidoglycan hydrolase CwlO-like protein